MNLTLMKKNLIGKIVLVTGANRGIGKALVEKLSELGAKVIMVARNREKGKKVLREFSSKGFQIDLKIADLAMVSDINRLYKEISRKYNHLDILINNAAINIEDSGTKIETIDLNITEKIMKVNFRGVLLMCRNFIPLLKKAQLGRIINISSGIGRLSVERPNNYPSYPSYSISKTAVNAITKILDKELKGDNIMIFSVDPGWVKTDLGGPNAVLSVKEGIETPIYLATENPSKLNSGFFYFNKKVVEW